MTEQTTDSTTIRSESKEDAKPRCHTDRRDGGLYLTGTVATERSSEQIPVFVATAGQTLGKEVMLIGPNNLGNLSDVKLTIRGSNLGRKVLMGKTTESRHGARHDDGASVGDWFFTRFLISEIVDISQH